VKCLYVETISALTPAVAFLAGCALCQIDHALRFICVIRKRSVAIAMTGGERRHPMTTGLVFRPLLVRAITAVVVLSIMTGCGGGLESTGEGPYGADRDDPGEVNLRDARAETWAAESRASEQDDYESVQATIGAEIDATREAEMGIQP
jgi:hypothetical protein